MKKVSFVPFSYGKVSGEKMSFKIERYIKLHIKPKPWWMPNFLWKFLLRELLVLNEFIV